VVRWTNANAENRGLAVYRDSSSANPLFDFATRANTGTREDLLKPFARFLAFHASAANVATMSWPGTFPRSKLTTWLLAFNLAAMLLVRISLVLCLDQSFIIFRLRRRTTAPTSPLPIGPTRRRKLPF
jgi:hypothetical protein